MKTLLRAALVALAVFAFGTANAATTATRITDNANTVVNVAPASTAAATTDPALVVALSPNSPISISASTPPAATTMQSAAVANGNGTSLTVTGYGGAILSIVSSPAMSGGTTVNFEASTDGTTWVAINAHAIGTQTMGTTTTADGDYRISVAAYKSLRARISAYSAGTVTIKGYVSEQSPALTTIQTVEAGTWTVQPGNTANTTAWKVDGSAVTQPVSIATAPVLVTGSAVIGKVGIDQTTPGTTNAVQLVAGTAGGWSSAYSANVTNTALAVDASPGQIGVVEIGNANGSICYLQIWNVAVGSVTVGTTAPTYSWQIPASGGLFGNTGLGIPFSTAITVAATTTRAGSTACGSGLDVNISYK